MVPHGGIFSRTMDHRSIRCKPQSHYGDSPFCRNASSLLSTDPSTGALENSPTGYDTLRLQHLVRESHGEIPPTGRQLCGSWDGLIKKRPVILCDPKVPNGDRLTAMLCG